MLNKKWIWGVVILLAAGGAFAVLKQDAYEPADSRFTGAYRFSDGRLAVLTPIDGNRFRLRYQQRGQVQLLIASDADAFALHDGFSASEDSVATGRFVRSAAGETVGLELSTGQEGRRIPLSEELGTFRSGDLMLRGKLVLPEGPGPHPVVVTVHGSEDYSAVDHYFMPYLLAASGMAAVAFDKRGTGSSEGDYTQDFFALADDVAAAAAWAVSHDDVDGARVNLMGFSQGGWIAPLAAAAIPGMRSLSIHFGVAVPVVREDRWGYVYELEKQGFGNDAIRQADEMNAALVQAIDHDVSEAWSAVGDLIDAHEQADWFQAIAGSDSLLGTLADPSVPLFGLRAWFWWHGGPTAPRTWDPAPTLAGLDVPQHWLLAGEDSSAPTPESVAVLERLRRAGEPIDVRVFPATEHGIVTFSEDATGARTSTGYAASYFDETVTWLRAQNDLTP